MLPHGQIKLLLEPPASYDSVAFDKWERALLNAGAAIVDANGWSIADHLLKKDECSGDDFPFPKGRAELAKARTLFRTRGKVAYGLIVQHVTESTPLEFISNRYRQNGTAGWDYPLSSYPTGTVRTGLLLGIIS